MVNINGKEWSTLTPSDIQNAITNLDFDESFYFELKDDRVSTKKLTEEVSAFSNTFGGYIFLGVTNQKQIEGCTAWNEQRIHTTIHDSLTPTPSFDIKKFTINTKEVYVIKINEGAEPPYITSSGKIYERLSSGSFPIKDSSKLSQIYNKSERVLDKLEKKISIPPASDNVNNIYGYIDIGFALVTSDSQNAIDVFNRADLKSIAQGIKINTATFSLSHIGDSLVYTFGGITYPNGHLPAHTNNFFEIMADGSARMRILLINNNQEDPGINMLLPSAILKTYREIYTQVMGELFPHKIAYAKKYESLTVRKQFQPYMLYDDFILQTCPDLQQENSILLDELRNYREKLGISTVVTDDRIPKTGLYTIDKCNLERWGFQYSAESMIGELFNSSFSRLGVIPNSKND